MYRNQMVYNQEDYILPRPHLLNLLKLQTG